MSILVVGSVALDTVQTPFGKVTEALGGSATYFAMAASLFAPVNMVAVVGRDFPKEHLQYLRSRPIDLSGLQMAPGHTFRWAGVYDYDLNTTHTLETRLNVFADFHPQLTPGYEETPFVFLANIDPDLQREVLERIKSPKVTMMDTMDFWIGRKREALEHTIRGVDIVTMNEAELRMFAGTNSVVAAARQVLRLGPKALIVKKGEYGAVLFTDSLYFVTPAYPLEEVKDPTGAGDSFAGGFMGYLAARGEFSPESIKQAMVHGSVIASFTVEEFSVRRLATVTWEEIASRYREFQEFTYFAGHPGPGG
ncbi:MAG: sugar kinase [Chloroflexi bacterium]|nr:sugar kinase [Chloroflexota bacterium]